MDPDQLASQKPADLDLHCFRNNIYRLTQDFFKIWNIPLSLYALMDSSFWFDATNLGWFIVYIFSAVIGYNFHI